ncbi:MFS transporter [Ignavibacteriales bacterium]
MVSKKLKPVIRKINPWQSLAVMPKSMWAVSFATFINRAGSMFLTFLAIYLTKYQGYSIEYAGYVLAAYGIGSLAAGPVVGKLADRFGNLPLMKLSLLLTSGVLFLFPFFDQFWMIIVLTTVLSWVSEGFRPANLALISEIVRPEDRKIAFALNRLAINLGFSIGPLLGGFLIIFDYHWIFIFDGLTSLLAFGFLYMTSLSKEEKERRSTAKNVEVEIVQKTSPFKDKRLIYYVIALSPVYIVFFSQLSTVSLYVVNELKLPEPFIGVLFLVNTMMVIFLEVPINSALSEWDDRKLLSVGGVLTGIGFGLFAFSTTVPTLIICMVILTFGEMIFSPASANYLAELAPSSAKGMYMGFLQFVFNISLFIGPAAGAFMMEGFGSKMMWIACFILSMIGVGLMWRLKKNHELVMAHE